MERVNECDLLIVDDKPNFRLFLKDFFVQKIPGIKTKLAEDGIEGYDLALKFSPRIIWTCIRMPRMSGLELIELIKEDPDVRYIRIVIYTAHHCGQIRNRAFALGAEAYLYKGDYGQLEEGLRIVADLLYTDTST